MACRSMFTNVQDGERIIKDSKKVDDFFANYHLRSIKEYFKGNDSLESAQVSWKILSDDGFKESDLAQRIGRPLQQIREALF